MTAFGQVENALVVAYQMENEINVSLEREIVMSGVWENEVIHDGKLCSLQVTYPWMRISQDCETANGSNGFWGEMDFSEVGKFFLEEKGFFVLEMEIFSS